MNNLEETKEQQQIPKPKTNTKDELIANVSHAVESCILISGQLLILYKYIKGRDDLKKLWWSTASPKERAAANKKKKGSSHESTRTHRPSKTSSRIK